MCLHEQIAKRGAVMCLLQMVSHETDQVPWPAGLQHYQIELPRQGNKKAAVESILHNYKHRGQIVIFVRANETVQQLYEVSAFPTPVLLWVSTVVPVITSLFDATSLYQSLAACVTPEHPPFGLCMEPWTSVCNFAMIILSRFSNMLMQKF